MTFPTYYKVYLSNVCHSECQILLIMEKGPWKTNLTNEYSTLYRIISSILKLLYKSSFIFFYCTFFLFLHVSYNCQLVHSNHHVRQSISSIFLIIFPAVTSLPTFIRRFPSNWIFKQMSYINHGLCTQKTYVHDCLLILQSAH